MSQIAGSSPIAAPRSRIGAIILACLLFTSLLPFALVEIPAMVDYPNHLARMSILARAGTAAAHPLYEVAWAPYPNLAMDLIVPPLARVIGVEAATKTFCLVAQVSVVGGAMALAAAAGGSVLVSGAVACLFIYAMPFAFGFLNFTFALGLALFAMATWVWLAHRSLALRLAVHAGAVAILFFAHLVALGLYGYAIGLVELWRARAERPPFRRFALLVAGMAAPVVVIAVLAAAGGGTVGGSGTNWSALAKVFWFGILNGWSRELSLAITLAFALPLYAAFRHGWLRLVGPGPWLAAGFALLFVALPFRLFDTAFVDGRALIAAILILPAFTRGTLPRGLARAFGALFVVCALANVGFAAFVQSSYRVEYRALLSVLESMPRGSRLLPADRREAEDPPTRLADYPMYHAATLAVHSRDAFVPTLFTSPGKQPLRAHASVQDIKLLEGGPIPWTLLQSYSDGVVPPPELAYVRNWTRDFDYVLLIHPDGQAPASPLLEFVANGGRFVLYRIRSADSPRPALTRP